MRYTPRRNDSQKPIRMARTKGCVGRRCRGVAWCRRWPDASAELPLFFFWGTQLNVLVYVGQKSTQPPLPPTIQRAKTLHQSTALSFLGKRTVADVHERRLPNVLFVAVLHHRAWPSDNASLSVCPSARLSLCLSVCLTVCTIDLSVISAVAKCLQFCMCISHTRPVYFIDSPVV